jgi:hypothetical protein
MKDSTSTSITRNRWRKSDKETNTSNPTAQHYAHESSRRACSQELFVIGPEDLNDTNMTATDASPASTNEVLPMDENIDSHSEDLEFARE